MSSSICEATVPSEATVLITHKNCVDGNICAWLIKKKFPNIEHIEIHPGQPFTSSLEGKTVIMADVIPTNITELAKTAKITVIDHHKETIESIKEVNFTLIYDYKKCASKNVWDYLFPDKKDKYPLLLEIDDGRDRFTWDHPMSKALTAYWFTTYYKTWDFESIMRLTYNEIEEQYIAGNMILDDNQKVINSSMNRAVLCEFYLNPEQMLLVYVTHRNQFVSEVGNQLCEKKLPESVIKKYNKTKVDFAAMWVYDLPSNEWWISLRAIEPFDKMGEITSKFGTKGGHPYASGITIKARENNISQTLYDFFTPI